MDDSIEKLYITDKEFIAYRKHEGKENHPGVIFLCGFMSDMEGIKALALEKLCRERGYNFIRFDYFGHGKSSRKFTDCTIGTWQQNVLDVIDQLSIGNQILVGSSMGGWLMLLAALERPMRIAALIGIASAPDFTEDLIWGEMNAAQRAELMASGIYNLKSEFSDNPYPVTRQLIEEGRKHLLLRGRELKKFRADIPVRLIHGKKDTDVPAAVSIRLSELLKVKDIRVNLVEDGDHRMSTPENIELLCNTLDEVMGGAC
jgi:pimeloyl-ACP methyl ester carboxylesterase